MDCGQYILPMPLHARPRLMVGGVPTHGNRRCEYYRLPGSWCLHAYRYDADIVVDNHPMEIHPGSVGVIPRDVDIAFTFRGYPSTHAYVHYEFDQSGPTVQVPAMQRLLLRFESFFAEMEQIVATMSVNRTRAEVRLWNLLWELADRYQQNRSGASQQHSAVSGTLAAIELQLDRPLRVEELAVRSGVSHNHLTRLFRHEMGMTVVAYIRKRRVERARQLLERSTRPIKSIAAEVGVADLQHFNKLIHQELGMSPREVREEGQL